MAESAVVVADEYQGRGMGKLLLRRLVSYARARGICTFRGNMQIGNNRMLDLVRRSGLPHQTRFVDGIWEVNIDIRLPEQQPMTETDTVSPAELASAFDAEHRALAVHKAATERAHLPEICPPAAPGSG